MKCPTCNGEMEAGNFTLPQNVTWYPGPRKRGFVKGQIFLIGRWRLASLFGKQVEGFICQKCRWASFQYPACATQPNHPLQPTAVRPADSGG
jgi:hypothetical protein